MSPVLCATGWVFFGPRGLVDRLVVALSLVYLLAWGVFSSVRGEVIDWYPYPFMDPNDADQGYGRVALNLVIIAVVIVALGAVTLAVDRRLAGRGDDAPAPIEPA